MYKEFNITPETVKRLIEFRDARNWEKYHTSPELARAIAGEAQELSELYLWGRNPESYKYYKEIADIAIYLLYFCKLNDVNLDDAINSAIDINEKNYPLSSGDRPDRDK